MLILLLVIFLVVDFTQVVLVTYRPNYGNIVISTTFSECVGIPNVMAML